MISLILNISPMGNLHSEMQTSNLLLLNTMYLSMKTSSSNIQSYVQTLACQEQRINSQARAWGSLRKRGVKAVAQPTHHGC